jgi:hypothetical protein
MRVAAAGSVGCRSVPGGITVLQPFADDRRCSVAPARARWLAWATALDKLGADGQLQHANAHSCQNGTFAGHATD